MYLRIDELSKIYIIFANAVNTPYSKTMKVLLSDNSIKYRDTSLHNFGRENRTCTLDQYFNTALALNISASCPKYFKGNII